MYVRTGNLKYIPDLTYKYNEIFYTIEYNSVLAQINSNADLRSKNFQSIQTIKPIYKTSMIAIIKVTYY